MIFRGSRLTYFCSKNCENIKSWINEKRAIHLCKTTRSLHILNAAASKYKNIECGATGKNKIQNSYQMGVYDYVFDLVKKDDSEMIDIYDLIELMNKAGISLNDPRLAKFAKSLNELQGNQINRNVIQSKSLTLDRETFRIVAKENLHMLLRIMTNDFCIPDFESFTKEIQTVFNLCKENKSGQVASYIPELKEMNPNYWGLSLCTVDGQRLSMGDSTIPFTIQSSSKPITYALALTDLGPQYVHQYVGYEPSGLPFNQISLNHKNKPHNPLINSGALAICSILQPNLNPSERFKYVENKFSQMAAGLPMGFNNAVFLSERETADRNFAIAYYMRENKCFPPTFELRELMDFYFQICSIEVTCESAGIMAGTLANGGINPLTNETVVSAAAARDTLSVMHSCGMYDYSGQFAFKVGLPCKSGVSGIIMVVVPNLLGLAVWSPPIDRHGNSARGIQFCQELVHRFILHHYESHLHYDKKIDPRKPRDSYRTDAVSTLLFAAGNNDLSTLRRCFIHGVDFNAIDYDGRTGLHVAASTGSLDAVKFFIEVGGVKLNPIDRWGHTPLSDAKQFGHEKIIEYLESKLLLFSFLCTILLS
uniref:glutaminase n=1 Tax=Schistosoma mansoni TaxID=6183 RepID=A0A3Q0KP92_SCHMA